MKTIVTASFVAVMALPTVTFGQNSSSHDSPSFFSQNPTSSQANTFRGYDYYGPGGSLLGSSRKNSSGGYDYYGPDDLSQQLGTQPKEFFRRLRLLRVQRPLPAAREQPEEFFRRLRLLRAQRPLPAAREQPEKFFRRLRLLRAQRPLPAAWEQPEKFVWGPRLFWPEWFVAIPKRTQPLRRPRIFPAGWPA